MFDWFKLIGVVDSLANNDKGYNTNKRRAAVVAYEGFSLSDFLRDNRLEIHTGAVGGAVVFALVGYVRRKHGMESWTLWGSLSMLCGGVAWYTRPVAGGVVVDENGNPVQSEEAKAVQSATDWLDRKAGELDKSDPGWDQRTFDRVMG